MACAALALGGCYAYAEPPVAYVDPPVVYAEAAEAPVEVDVQTYPQTVYEGRPTYFTATAGITGTATAGSITAASPPCSSASAPT